MGGKMLEVLKEVVPQVSRVAVILDLEQPPHVAMWCAVEVMAKSFGVSLTAPTSKTLPKSSARSKLSHGSLCRSHPQG
jgi:hypothetical protein